MLRFKLFDGVEKNLAVFNGQAILNEAIELFVEDCSTDETDEQDFTFPSFGSGFFRIFNERLGREIKDITLTRSGSSLVVNASVSDMTFDENGNYWFEIGYVDGGGYELVLVYGILKVV